MKYAVAYMNFFDNNLKLTQVEADDPITAMIEGACILMEAKDDENEWLNGLMPRRPVSPAWYASRIKEIQEEFFNTDQVIAVMPIE